ncbi:unnamed protein product, partial [Oppiella nova]
MAFWALTGYLTEEGFAGGWPSVFYVSAEQGVFLYGLRGGGDVPTDADMTSNYMGTVFAIANSIAFTCGIITPLVIGVIVGDTNEHTRRQWGYVFYMSAALNIFGGLVFIIFGSAKQQPWDIQPDNDRHLELTYVHRYPAQCRQINML